MQSPLTPSAKLQPPEQWACVVGQAWALSLGVCHWDQLAQRRHPQPGGRGDALSAEQVAGVGMLGKAPQVGRMRAWKLEVGGSPCAL